MRLFGLTGFTILGYLLTNKTNDNDKDGAIIKISFFLGVYYATVFLSAYYNGWGSLMYDEPETIKKQILMSLSILSVILCIPSSFALGSFFKHRCLEKYGEE
jgi:hypothetical protein